MTQAEVEEANQALAEKKLHELIESLLRQRNYHYLHARMDRKTTLRKGAPDFIIILPGERCLMVEVKVDGNTLSEDQIRYAAEYHLQTGGIVHLVRSLGDLLCLLPSPA
jgi:DNA anti-recombination protein RmuC